MNISSEEFENIKELAKIDPGMKDLLEKVMEYYVLKGSPKRPYYNAGYGYDQGSIYDLNAVAKFTNKNLKWPR